MSSPEQKGFIQILIRDLTAEMHRAASTKDEIQRRSVVRSGFATVEFVTFIHAMNWFMITIHEKLSEVLAASEARSE